MTGTVVDALQAATEALNNATNNVLALQQQLQTAATQAQTNATTVINNFLSRPLNQTYFVDPLNGNDSNNGLTYATSKKTIDSVLAAQGAQAIVIQLYGDTTMVNRNSIVNNLTIFGVQVANTPSGTTPVFRTISFLGTAENSPDVYGNNFASGINFGDTASFLTDHIYFELPAQPAVNNGVRSHILSVLSLDVIMAPFELGVVDQTAAALLGSFNGGRITATLSPVFGPGTPGHLFDGIAAGENPNSVWQYQSNVISA